MHLWILIRSKDIQPKSCMRTWDRTKILSLKILKLHCAQIRKTTYQHVVIKEGSWLPWQDFNPGLGNIVVPMPGIGNQLLECNHKEKLQNVSFNRYPKYWHGSHRHTKRRLIHVTRLLQIDHQDQCIIILWGKCRVIVMHGFLTETACNQPLTNAVAILTTFFVATKGAHS